MAATPLVLVILFLAVCSADPADDIIVIHYWLRDAAQGQNGYNLAGELIVAGYSHAVDVVQTGFRASIPPESGKFGQVAALHIHTISAKFSAIEQFIIEGGSLRGQDAAPMMYATVPDATQEKSAAFVAFVNEFYEDLS